MLRGIAARKRRNVPLWFAPWFAVFVMVTASVWAAPHHDAESATHAESVEHDHEHHELFEGPEKTLSLRFTDAQIEAGSLRAIPRVKWEEVLVYAQCEILSAVESGAPILVNSSAVREASLMAGLTGYLLSESSLFLSDSTLTLKTCGRTTPLAALEPILDLVVPSWKRMAAERYLKYASFTRLGYMRPDEQLEPHTSWEDEVSHMEMYFAGEAVILGDAATSLQHVYVASYLSDGERIEANSLEVALTNLNTAESMRRYGGGASGRGAALDPSPLTTAWPALHSGLQHDAAFDERFFEPIGYSSNAVAGAYYTTVHVTPQPGCSYLSVETTAPLHNEARERFVLAVRGMCGAGTLAVTELAIGKSLLHDEALDLTGFQLLRSSYVVKRDFAVTYAHYERDPPWNKKTLALVRNETLLAQEAPRAMHSGSVCAPSHMLREGRASVEGDVDEAEQRAASALMLAML